ncbi:peptide chain release factor N(5)-glutamine methyltransferase [Candidatus Uhrbacteria bacterium]|nr:peptide chain release factor N(5)-glutamine methyltransferase [Candidatus Uhrbacteria bacterium]
MTANQTLQWAMEKLQKAGVDSPALDAELLFIHALHSAIRANRRMDRTWLYAHGKEQVRMTALRRYKKLIARRIKREPVAYILGHKEFYGLDFLVNRSVLIPRPETEILVERALDEIRNWKLDIRNLAVVDVGTGSGAIAVAVAKECKIKNVKCKIIATDISVQALKVAKKNAWRHGVDKKITFLRGNLLEPAFNVILNEAGRSEGSRTNVCASARDSSPPTQNDRLVIVANLPYLPTAEWRGAQPEIKKWEPRAALDGGKDGLKYYRKLFAQLKFLISNFQYPISVFCELCPHQFSPFKRLAREFFPSAKFRVEKDLSRQERVVIVNVGE